MRKFRQPMSDPLASHGVLGAIQPFEVWNGGDGNDTHTGTSSDDTLNGNGGNDTLNGGDGSDLIDGGEGNDKIAGDAGDDALNGGVGDDTITSTSGADTVDGGDGADLWIGSYAKAKDSLVFDERTQTLSNGTTLAGIESIQLTTGSGNDRFTMNGDQRFSLNASQGFDTFAFDPTSGSRAAAPLVVTITSSGYYNVTLQDGAVTNIASNIESLSVVGSSGDDEFQLSYSPSMPTGGLVLDGGAGNDRLAWDLTGYTAFTLEVAANGVITSSYGTISRFEAFDLKLYFGANTVTLGDGDDTVQSGGSNDQIKTGGGNDSINASGSYVTIDGGSGDDIVRGNGKRDVISGGDGDDVIYSIGNDSTIDGGSGYDRWAGVFSHAYGFDQATGKFGNGLRLVSIEAITITSSDDAHLSFLHIVEASDLTVYSGNALDNISISLGGLAGGVQLVATSDLDRDSLITFGETVIHVNNRKNLPPTITFRGTEFDDMVTLNDIDSTKLLPSLDGGGGFDTLGIYLGTHSEFLVADDGTITSTFGHYANFEQFAIHARDGDNTIALGAGDDTITVLAAATGTNDLSGGGGADVITGALGADTIRGGDGDDTLTGSDGDDLLNGGLGDDVIDGGAGVDSVGYDGATAGVTVSLLKVGVAQDTKGAGIDTLTGIENLYGTEFKDKLIGDAFANLLRGREGDDLLKGGAGDDRLEGGPGADRMAGGKGADTFAFLKLTDISLGAPDRITDFRHANADKIELSNIDLSKDAGDQFFTFIGTSAFSGRTDIFELRVEDAGNKTFLVQGDVNHDGVADFTFDVKTDAPLVANDFVL